MWGHTHTCACSICASLNRVFVLIKEGTHLPGFVPLAGGHVRVLEGEVRDTLTFCYNKGGTGPPKETEGEAPLSVPVPQHPPHNPRLPESKQGEERASASHLGVAKEPAPSAQCLVAKSKPPSPRKSVAPSPVPAEPADRPEGSEDAKDLEVQKKKKKKRRSPSRHSRRSRSRHSAKARSSRGDKDKRRSRSRSRRRERRESAERRREPRRSAVRRRSSRGDKRSPSKRTDKERKRRDEKPPEPRTPPRPRTPPYPPGPRSPPGPPPGYRAPQGRGWIGPLPISDHPRWTESTNKGQVKRAKQERYARRR